MPKQETPTGAGLSCRGRPGVAWLALVNTAFAFILWNHILKVLTAVESSVLNNTMLVQLTARRATRNSGRQE